MAISRFILCWALGAGVFCDGFLSTAVAQEDPDQPDVAADFDELTRSFEKLASSLEKKVEESAEKYGKELETWAEQFGKEMESWAEENAGEWETWATENGGKLEGMAKELEQRLAGLEQELKREFEESGLLEKVEKAVSEMVEASQDSLSTVDDIRKELDNADPKDPQRAKELRHKLMERWKEEKLQKEQANLKRDRDTESNSKHKYLEQRLEEIRKDLKQEIPQQKRAVLERALAQLTDLKSATAGEEREVQRASKAPSVAAGRVVQEQPRRRMKEKQLESMIAEEQRRHAMVMERMKKELGAVRREKELAALAAQVKREKELAALAAQERERDKLRKTEAETQAGKEREKAELEKLRDEVRRLKKELDSIKKQS